MNIKTMAALCALALLAACGGGGGGSPPGGGGEPSPPPARQQLIGEVVNLPEQVTASELNTSAGYAGNDGILATSTAIQAAGKQNLLDLGFVLAPASPGIARHTQTTPDAEQQLARYARDHAALLVPGIRLLVADEVFLNPLAAATEPGAPAVDDGAVMQRQLDAIQQALAMVRRVMPQASVGITVSPYATFGRPQTLDYIKKAIALADWVGTDPYWLDDGTPVQLLHDWSRTFPALAKAANPKVETWLIAQAFKLPVWHTDGFNSYMAQHLGYAPLYDNVLFFGWQFTSELDPRSAGMYFPAETKRLYQKYLRNPVP